MCVCIKGNHYEVAMSCSDVKSRVERGALGHADKSGVELGEEADETFDSAHLVGRARAHQPLVVDAQSGGKELVEEGAVLLENNFKRAKDKKEFNFKQEK